MARTLISENFPRSIAYRGRWDLDGYRAARWRGQVYDALVALAARSVDRTLLTPTNGRCRPTWPWASMLSCWS